MDERGPHTTVAQREPRRAPGRPSSLRRVFTLLAIPCLVVAAGALATAACSRVTTHRMLTFFYDGVPPLDGATQPGLDLSDVSVEATGDEPALGVRTKQRFYSHPAYRKNLCGGCHDAEGGKLLKTAREGLCRTCHPDKPAKKEFVHGPVAVDGCLACHHFHKAPYPKVLIADEQSLCFRCHVTEELSAGGYHATIKEEHCVDCHDSHGGDDRYFLTARGREALSSLETP